MCELLGSFAIKNYYLLVKISQPREGVWKFMAYKYLCGRGTSGKWVACHLTAGTKNTVKH